MEETNKEISEEDKKEELVKRQEEANAKTEELLNKQEALKEDVGGESEAGTKPEKPKELTPEEMAKAFSEGELASPFK